MKRLFFILLFLPTILSAQYYNVMVAGGGEGGAATEYVWGALAWYEFLGDLTDSYDSNDGSLTGNASYPGDTCLYFYESDRNDFINIGDFIPTDCDTITISYLINLVTDDNTIYRTHGNDTPGSASDPGTYTVYDGTGTGYYNILWRGVDNDGSNDYATTVSGGDCVSNITDDEWHHVVEIYRRSSSTRFYLSCWVDGTYCFDSGGDSIINKGGWELFGKDWIFGKSDVGVGANGVADTYFNHLMFFRGDGRYNPDGNIVDILIADPYNMPTK